MGEFVTGDVEIAGRPHYVLALKPVPAAASVGREVVRAGLCDWGLTSLAHDAGVVVTELIANAIRHAAEVTLLMYAVGPERLALEVWDDSPDPPVVADGGLDAESGRGLLLVGAYAQEWGWRPVAGGGKVVWAIVGPDDPNEA